MEEIARSLPWFIIGYLLVMLVGVLHTTFNVHVMKLPVRTEKGLGDAYRRTRRYHPIYDLILFTYSGYMTMRIMPYPYPSTAMKIGLAWTVISALIDMIFGVLVKHPFRQGWREFYLEHQPWLLLSYLAIFISPLLGSVFVR